MANYFSISTLYIHLNIPIIALKICDWKIDQELILLDEHVTCIDDDEVISKICQSNFFDGGLVSNSGVLITDIIDDGSEFLLR